MHLGFCYSLVALNVKTIRLAHLSARYRLQSYQRAHLFCRLVRFVSVLPFDFSFWQPSGNRQQLKYVSFSNMQHLFRLMDKTTYGNKKPRSFKCGSLNVCIAFIVVEPSTSDAKFLVTLQ